MDIIHSNSPAVPATTNSLTSITRSDRWRVYRRLQELDVVCACPEDGSLQVEISHPIAILHTWSVVFQLTASRQQLIAWLEQCLIG